MNQALNNELIRDLESRGHLDAQSIEALNQSEASPAENKIRQIIDKGLVEEDSLADSISRVFGLERTESEQFPFTPIESTTELGSFLLEHEVLPLYEAKDDLVVAMCDPSNQLALNVLESKLDKRVVTKVAVRSELYAHIKMLYPSEHQTSKFDLANTDTPRDLGNEDRGVRSVHQVIQAAIASNASDIHFEPAGVGLTVRFRVHGILRSHRTFPDSMANRVQARLKLMSGMDVSQKRLPQSGRFQFPYNGRVFDFRCSTLPLHNGESIVLRVLESKLGSDSLENLGFRPSLATELRALMELRQGLLLITGPTGSGKSTTLYSLLNILDGEQLKIISIEDPVELAIPTINQIQIDPEHGVTFSSALKAVMRQDPDVIMVGEIRDEETASLAAQAALTGHLVLSTLHTNSAVSTIDRLRNLGLQDYMIDASLKGVLAQRLIRTRVLNQDRSVPSKTIESQFEGRSVIAEYLPFREFHTLKTNEQELYNDLFEGFSLHTDAQRVLDEGRTELQEVRRILGNFQASKG